MRIARTLVTACAVGLASSALLSYGCAAPPPEVAELPAFVPVKFDGRYQPTTKRISFNVRPRNAGPITQQNPELPLTLRSSIVISVPELGSNTGATTNATGEALRSAATFNDLEQQVEFALLDKGFDLRDRSKFEARRIRDDGDADSIETQAELLNAAQGPDGQSLADYVLQINEIRTERDKVTRIDPLDYPQVVNFANANPGLAESGAISEIVVKHVEASFNAKIIKVDTGSIMWVGTHKVNSMDLPPRGVEVTISVTPTPKNLDDLVNEAKDYENQLDKAYRSAKARRDALTDPRTRLTSRQREEATAEYERLIGVYEEMVAGMPTFDESRYVYDYEYSVSMDPDFLTIFGEGGPGSDAQRAHELELLQVAALEAIETIEVTR